MLELVKNEIKSMMQADEAVYGLGAIDAFGPMALAMLDRFGVFAPDMCSYCARPIKLTLPVATRIAVKCLDSVALALGGAGYEEVAKGLEKGLEIPRPWRDAELASMSLATVMHKGAHLIHEDGCQYGCATPVAWSFVALEYVFPHVWIWSEGVVKIAAVDGVGERDGILWDATRWALNEFWKMHGKR